MQRSISIFFILLFVYTVGCKNDRAESSTPTSEYEQVRNFELLRNILGDRITGDSGQLLITSLKETCPYCRKNILLQLKENLLLLRKDRLIVFVGRSSLEIESILKPFKLSIYHINDRVFVDTANLFFSNNLIFAETRIYSYRNNQVVSSTKITPSNLKVSLQYFFN